MKTIQVKPWAEGQGDSVTIDAASFNPDFHVRLDGDDTPLPGPFDDLSREALVELAVADFRDELTRVSHEELLWAVTQSKRRRDERAREEAEEAAARAAEATAAAEAAEAAERDPMDRDGDGNPGGDLPDGFELGEDGVSVVQTTTGWAWPNVEEFRAWRTERADLVAALSVKGVEWEGDLDNAALTELLDTAKDGAGDDTSTDEGGADGPVEIPANWQDSHWTQIVKLAKAISGPEAAEAIKSKDDAVPVVTAEVARRAAEAAGEA